MMINKNILLLIGLFTQFSLCMNPEKAQLRGWTLLHQCAYQQNSSDALKQLIKEKIEKGESIDPKDEEGKTPFLVALAWGNTKAAQILFEAGADYEHDDNYGFTPLHRAAQSGNLPMVKKLLEIGVIMRPNGVGETALHSLAYKGMGAQKFSDHWLKLHQALCADYILCFQKNHSSTGFELIKNALSFTSKRGWTAEQYAVSDFNNWPVIAVLRAHAAEMDADKTITWESDFVKVLRLLQSEKEQAEERAERAEKTLQLICDLKNKNS